MHTANAISAYFVGVPGGLVMSMIAFSIVFIVILGLMLIMMATKHVGAALDSVGKKPAGGAAPTSPAAPAQAVAVPAGDDSELMAVISAAVMAVCGSAARVVSFSAVKAPAASTWKFVGRMQNAEGFQD